MEGVAMKQIEGTMVECVGNQVIDWNTKLNTMRGRLSSSMSIYLHGPMVLIVP